MEIRTKREIKKLQEKLITTTRELEQANAAQNDLTNKLQYVEQLLEKTKVDLRHKSSRIKALENHPERSPNEISSLNQQLDYVKESDSIREELKHAYELHPESTRTRRPLMVELEEMQTKEESGRLKTRANEGLEAEPYGQGTEVEPVG